MDEHDHSAPESADTTGATGAESDDIGSEETAPAASMPRSEEAESSDGNSLLTTIVIIGLVLVVIAIGGVAYYLYTENQTKQELVAQADQHVVAATQAIEQIDAGWEEFALAESDEASEAFASGMESTTELIATARAELDQAAATAEKLPESTFQTEFLSAVSLLGESIDAYEQLFTGMDDTMEISTTLSILGEEMDAAKTLLNEAVDDIDEGRYSDGEEKAERAKNSYETVAERYLELAQAYPTSEAEKLAAIAEKNATQAEYAIEMAQAGRRGAIGDFNEYVEKYSAVNEEIRELPLPSWAADVTLLTAESSALLEEAAVKRDEAVAAYERAFEAYEAGDF
jgi:hypothetical protein